MALQIRQAWSFLSLRVFDTSTAEGRAQERHRRVLLTALASILAKVISVLTLLISVPLTLHYLGPERYGMWLTISSLAAVLSFADFGIGNGILTAVATAYGADPRAIRGYVSSGFFVLTPIAVGLMVIFGAAYDVVPWYKIFNVTSALAQREAGPAMAVFVICFTVAIPAGITQRVQMGLQRGFMANLWQCVGSLLALIGVIIAINLEAGLCWLILAYMGAPLFANFLNGVVFFGWLESGIAPSVSHVSSSAVKRITKTGGLFLILQIATAFTYTSDNLIIAHVLDSTEVAQYAVPERLFSTISMVLTMILTPLWPAYSEAIARGDDAWVKRTLKHSFFASVGFSFVVSALLLLAGPSLIHLWVGPLITPSFFLLLGLAVWKVVESGGRSASTFLNGANIVRLQVVTSIATALFAVFIKIFLVSKIGVAGAVWGTAISYLALTALPIVFVLAGPRQIAVLKR